MLKLVMQHKALALGLGLLLGIFALVPTMSGEPTARGVAPLLRPGPEDGAPVSLPPGPGGDGEGGEPPADPAPMDEVPAQPGEQPLVATRVLAEGAALQLEVAPPVGLDAEVPLPVELPARLEVEVDADAPLLDLPQL
jgi:hypothetical protein